MEPINWRAMTPTQRDETIHEKVFGHERTTKHFLVPDTSAVWSIGETYKIRSLQTWQTGGPDTPRYSQSMDTAWLVVEHITRPPESRDEAKNASATRFMLWFECAKLWACSRDEAINEICIAALRMLGYTVLTEEVSQ